MGYTTEFAGRFNSSRTFTDAEAAELRRFSEERHGGNLEPHAGYPGFWCDWAPTPGNDGIAWNGSEKFYSYVEWLQLIIRRFMVPWGIELNGVVAWRGEQWGDIGTIRVDKNLVSTFPGEVDMRQVTS